MAEYVFEELIINPKKPGLENLIGKEVYCNDVPLACLDHANEHRRAGILREVREESSDYPFRVETPEGEVLGFVCIIPKKNEPKPEYIPFESMEEFVESYVEAKGRVKTDSFEDNLLQCGMWLKYTDDNDKPVYTLVCEIKDEGVKLDEHGQFSWEELFSKGLLFPNDTPCGKLVAIK